MLMGAFSSEYVFSAAAIPHRCKVPECGESSDNFEFQPEWILNAIPETSSGISSCQRYVSLNSNGSLDYCPADMFNQSIVIDCDAYLYGKNNTVVYEFDLGCQEWYRAFAGTVCNIGLLVALPVTGYFSDRYGRRLALVVNIFNFGLFACIRAFSTSYTMYLLFQFLQTCFGAGIYSSSYIFATEMVGPKYRVLTGAICPSMFAVGLMILGSVAWAIDSWRYMILALHIPCFLIVSYYWILGESIRWLLSKQIYDRARTELEKVAKTNNIKISDKSMERLLRPKDQMTSKSGRNLISSVLQSRVLLRRVCTTPFWWISMTLVYYGLSINSTSLSSAMHLNYILTCGIEIPGNFATIFILDRIGRKPTLSSGFFLSAACNFLFVIISNNFTVLRLMIYLLGKFGISIVVTSLYVYTSELYPTEYRHSLLAFSSMIGRIGSISAPLTNALPVLATIICYDFPLGHVRWPFKKLAPVVMNTCGPVINNVNRKLPLWVADASYQWFYVKTDTQMVYWNSMPFVLFGCMGTLAGLLVLTQPETLGTKLPDTLAEAEDL